MLPGYLTFPEFFAHADALREAFDAHFAHPEAHQPETHQVWNYWNVPDQYTYLRTMPEKVLPPALVAALHEDLRQLAADQFGLSQVSWPYLSLYVAGCGQGLHNDATNGRLGYVYSLTRWEDRRFGGGETLIMRETPYFGSAAMTRAMAATSFYDLVPARFNQLLVFDDRLPHAVPRIEGSMLPGEGRVVIHGHFQDGPPLVAGALSADAAEAAIAVNRPALDDLVRTAGRGLGGLLTLRLAVGGRGMVQGCDVLLDRLLPLAPDAAAPADAIAAVVAAVWDWQFPPAGRDSRVVVAVPFAPAPP
jgi:hypothetical protein